MKQLQTIETNKNTKEQTQKRLFMAVQSYMPDEKRNHYQSLLNMTDEEVKERLSC